MAPCQRDTCAMIFFGIVGFFALIALIIARATLVPAYNFGEEFEMATCRIGSVDYLDTQMPCQYCYSTSTHTCTTRHSSSPDCRTRSKTKCRMTTFPCITINITYSLGDSQWNEALLHYDQDHMTGEPRCSYQICKANPVYSRKIVEDYAAKYRSMGPGEDFTCFVNPALDSDAIETKKYTKNHVFQGTLWPALILTICIVIIIALLVWKYRRNQKRKERRITKEKTVAESIPLNIAPGGGVVIPPPEAAAVPPPGYTPTAQPYGPLPNAGYPPPQPAAMPPPHQPYPPPQGMPGYPPPQPGYYPPPQPSAYPPPYGGPPQGGAYAPPQGGAYPPPQGGAYPPPLQEKGPYPFEAAAAKQ